MMSKWGYPCEKREVYSRDRDVMLLWEAWTYNSLRAVYVNVTSINNGEKAVRLIAKQGKSNLTLSYGYLNLFIVCWILSDNMIA